MQTYKITTSTRSTDLGGHHEEVIGTLQDALVEAEEWFQGVYRNQGGSVQIWVDGEPAPVAVATNESAEDGYPHYWTQGGASYRKVGNFWVRTDELKTNEVPIYDPKDLIV